MEEKKEKVETGLKDESYYELDEILERIENRKLEKRNKQKKARKKFIIILFSIFLFVGLFIFSFSTFFDVDSIEVRGNSYFTAEEIINMGHAEAGRNLIYHPDKSNIINYLEKNPYIKNAKVSRGLPSTLIITVEERQQIGAIKYDDDFLIIDDQGFLLRKTRTSPKATIIEGIKVRKIEVGSEIGVEDEDLLGEALRILSDMQKKDLYFVRLDMSEMYIKAYVYEYLVCKGTYTQLLEGIDKDQLHKILDKLFGDGIKRGTITFSSEGYASFVPTI